MLIWYLLFLLCSAPERVMLCLIPDMAGSPDVGMHIQHTLVRSFCWENDIRLLTVRVSFFSLFVLNTGGGKGWLACSR